LRLGNRVRFEPGVAEAGEVSEGAEVLCIQHVFVAGEEGEGVAAAALLEDDTEEALGFVVFGELGRAGGPLEETVVLSFEVLPAGDHETSRDTLETLEAPLGGGHLLDEESFDGAFGRVPVFEGGVEFEVGLLVLFGKDEVAGEQAVADGVEAGAGLAEGGAGPGAAAGVFAVCFDLTVGCHEYSLSASGEHG
jgi:hypothetical protein